jgi:hypothetical protein
LFLDEEAGVCGERRWSVEVDGRILLVEGVTWGGDETGGMVGRDVDWVIVDGVPVDGFGREGVDVDVERYIVVAIDSEDEQLRV